MKKCFAILTVIFLSLTTFFVPTEAKTLYEINSLDEILKITNENKLKKSEEIEKLAIQKVNPTAIKDYANYLFEEIENISNSLEAVNMDLTKDGASNTRKFNLSTGSTLIIEETIEFDELNSKATHNVPTGKCSASFKYIINSDILLPDTYVTLTMYFNASQSSGLTATDTSAKASSFTPYLINVASHRITDGKAEKIGYDIDATATYNCTYGFGNWGWTKTPSLTGYIEWTGNVVGGLKVKTTTSFKW